MNRAPLRFLIAVLLLWAGFRTAMLLPGLPDAVRPIEAAAAAPGQRVRATSSALIPPASPAPEPPPRPASGPRSRPTDAAPRRDRPLEAARPSLPAGVAFALPLALQGGTPPERPRIGAPPAHSSRPSPRSRWSMSAWLLARDEGGAAALAPGGTLGGSQAGARIGYQLGGGLSLSARAYLPLRHRAGAELAAGVDWQPVRSAPMHLLAERRQRLGRDGRNAFALTLYGGGRRVLTPHLRLDAYGQAGVVGRQARDLFVDGALRLSRRVGSVDVGAGAWGAVQPGAHRLDAGPSLGWRLPLRDANLRLQADWRFRIAGDAAPGSGPALTLAADF